MEITFEFEDSDILVEFEPDFDIDINFCDIEKVQWSFQDGNHSGAVADLFSGLSKHKYTAAYIFQAV